MKVNITIDNLTESQAIAVEELLAGWQLISDSNDITVWTGFFCDGKFDWKPKIKFNIIYSPVVVHVDLMLELIVPDRSHHAHS